jgi:MoaA/NifB/PqqE/SkfB family radical SAM enzyme
MSFKELTALSSTMPKFQDLWLSGGEPFLRQDLAEIIELFYANNGVRGVRIPTNGLPTRQTIAVTKTVLKRCPQIQLEVDISIDGFAETHDRIRAVPENFRKAVETMSQLEQLRAQWPNLTVYVNSVITSENREEIIQLGNHFKMNHDLDGHYFQIIRGEPKDPTLQTIDPHELKTLYRDALKLNTQYVSKPRPIKTRLDLVRKAFWKAGYGFTYDTQLSNYAWRAKWKMPCTAGQTSVVIDYNADVRVCELRRPIGNLREYGMDFQKFWESVERRKEVRQVKTDECFCTHVCFIYDSMRHSKRVMLWELPKRVARQAMKSLTSAIPRQPSEEVAPTEAVIVSTS